MSATPKLFYRGAAATSSATLYTVPSSTTSVLTDIVISNTSANQQYVTITVDGINLIPAVPISANAVINFQFKTVIALHLNNTLHTFEGICEGNITETKQGNQGFGYDPVFKPNTFNETFAEMDLTRKNKISHRGKAIQLLVNFLNS